MAHLLGGEKSTSLVLNPGTPRKSSWGKHAIPGDPLGISLPRLPVGQSEHSRCVSPGQARQCYGRLTGAMEAVGRGAIRKHGYTCYSRLISSAKRTPKKHSQGFYQTDPCFSSPDGSDERATTRPFQARLVGCSTWCEAVVRRK